LSTIILFFSVNSIAIENTAKDETIYDDSDFIDDFLLVDENTYKIDDPYERFNRTMFSINKGLDKVIFEPVAHGYRFLVPEFGRDRVDNVLVNLKEPVNILNSLIQLDPDKLSRSVGRFLTNTILGFGGLIDVASQADIEAVHEDFGLSLGTYGIDTGSYIYLPILGPSSPRDLLGRTVDTFSDPYIYFAHKDAIYVRSGIEAVNTRESLIEVFDNIEKTSIDPYVIVKSIYVQKRKVRK